MSAVVSVQTGGLTTYTSVKAFLCVSVLYSSRVTGKRAVWLFLRLGPMDAASGYDGLLAEAACHHQHHRQHRHHDQAHDHHRHDHGYPQRSQLN